MHSTNWATLMVTVALASGCSKKPPGCADAETTATARQMVVDGTAKYMAEQATDDPDGWLQKFTDTIKVDLSGVVGEGYKAEAKKQLCRATLKVTTMTGAEAERAIEYSTQLTEDQKGAFLLEIRDFAPFIVSTGAEARKYYDANRWAGTWNGTYACQAVGGIGEGMQGPFSMPVSMVVQGSKAKLERTTRSGGYEVLEGELQTFGPDKTVYLRGEGKNTTEDSWFTVFKGAVAGKRLTADGVISATVNDAAGGEGTARRVPVRSCTLDVTLGAPASPEPTTTGRQADVGGPAPAAASQAPGIAAK